VHRLTELPDEPSQPGPVTSRRAITHH
jgi:hypothetical protein